MAEEHFTHEHPLSFQQWPEGKYCSGCKFPIVHGSVYKCWECNFYLHEQCFKAERYFDHPFHTTHPLNLHPKPTYPGRFFYCEICRQEGHGFSYSCSDCDFDLHIHCALAPVGTGGTGYYNYNYPQNTSGSYGGGNYNNYYTQNSTPSYGGDYPAAGYPPAGGYKYYGDNSQFHNNPSDYYATGNEFPQGNQQSADYADQYGPESTFFPQEIFRNPATNQENRPTDDQFGQVSDAASDESIANSPKNTAALSNELPQTDDQYHPVLETAANAPAGQYYSPQDGQSGPESDPNRTTKVSRAGDENQLLSQDVEHFVHHTLRPYNVPLEDPVLCSVCNQKLSGSAYRCSVHLHESCFHLVEPEEEEEEEEESGEHLVEASKDVATKTKIGRCKSGGQKNIRRLSLGNQSQLESNINPTANVIEARENQARPQNVKDFIHHHTIRLVNALKGSKEESEEGPKNEEGMSEEHFIETSVNSSKPQIAKMPQVKLGSAATKFMGRISQWNDRSQLKSDSNVIENVPESSENQAQLQNVKHFIRLRPYILSKDPEEESKEGTKEEQEEEEEKESGEHSVEALANLVDPQVIKMFKLKQGSVAVETISHDSVDTKITPRKFVTERIIRQISPGNNQSLLKVNPNPTTNVEQFSHDYHTQRDVNVFKVEEEEEEEEYSVEASDESINPQVIKMLQQGSVATKTTSHASGDTKTASRKFVTKRIIRRIS